MPRKSKKPPVHKTKNIIQNVVVKVGTEEKKRKRGRKPRRKAVPARDQIVVQANVPPVVIQQLPAAFQPPEVPRFVNPMKEEKKEFITPVAKASVGIQADEMIIPVGAAPKTESPFGVGYGEFGPTSSFPSREDIFKYTQPPEEIYRGEPPSFRSPVEGHFRFGQESYPVAVSQAAPPMAEATVLEIKKRETGRTRAAKQYQETFGKMPPAKMNEQTILEAIDTRNPNPAKIFMRPRISQAEAK